jgi:hypothetical protein
VSGTSKNWSSKALSLQAQLHQQYLTRAQTILSGEQLAAFQEFLAKQEAGLKAFLQRGAKMFAPGQIGN